ncbi:glycosyltransferase [Desulfofustis glycolicus]|uniref:Beta-monoglucosyldiacylglycerol synthase n=1 Tax=Desulfofustis glycolicus DSM 9705 TaxID=1121409 RepID=A0A1M5V603_9BACT|nr:glycosyltransferase [Desulfofustis glycolicus]MCB2214965.1 glycosyltransferase [Desulfobulbaceae bacterium]SHH70692.1 Exo-beta-1,3-glucanase, GH17 family [Desulfofustis glycolicus DSM 9705]
MTRINTFICVTVALVSLCCWALLNRPEIEPPWPDRIQGFSFSPLRIGHNPVKQEAPSIAEIDSDLQLLAGQTNAIRTYSVDGILQHVPSLAQKYGLNVTLGAWISDDLEENERQLETVIYLARQHYHNVIRVIVGNEALLRGDVSTARLHGYLDRVREALDIPVSTAEPWHIWQQQPDLADHVDFIAVHLLPYWEGIHLDRAVDHVIDRHDMLKLTFPEKEIVITEVGWPSNGRIRQDAVASTANQAAFLRRFLDRAERLDLVYYVLEAFDQPWKRTSEGTVGAYWGVYDADRRPKFPFTTPIVNIPKWHILAAISVALSLLVSTLLLIDSRSLRKRGCGFLAAVAVLCASGAVWIVYSYWRQYMTPGALTIGALMLIGLTGVLVVLLAEAHEWAESLWGGVGRRFSPPITVTDDLLPKVSIHVPAYNEPPQMLIETLNALSELDYPDFEVIVMDNNTKDPSVWQPVREHCLTLGERFRFFHEDRLTGFKAGALNYALARTAADTSVVAVIDSDYVVKRNWLRDLAPHFLKPQVAIVQAPQDYRDDRDNLFKTMCYAEYRGFFCIGMITRNERNAIIQHGTMTMVRKAVLTEIEGWAPWCITEDAELGLHIFEKGYEAIYVPTSYGKGLMPDTFIDFKKQRYRWAYGAVQIMRQHARTLLGSSDSRLTRGQRYHFIAGWLPWLADGINLLFTLAALAWSAAMIQAPLRFEPPLLMISLIPLSLFFFKLAKMIYLYRRRVNASAVQTIASALAGLSLTHTIAKAVLFGLVSSNLPFFRTPKRAAAGTIRYALQAVREEGLLATALLAAIYGIIVRQGVESPDLLLWVMVLLVQTIPYLAAVLVSFIAAGTPAPTSLIATLAKPISVTGNRQEGSTYAPLHER